MAKRKSRNGFMYPAFYWLNTNTFFRHFNRHEKNTIAKASFLCVALMLTWITFGKNGLLHYLEVKEDLRATIDRKKGIQEENKRLRTQIAKIQNNPQYLEKVARQRYYMTRENEVVFRFD